jgi:hypothetical protein
VNQNNADFWVFLNNCSIHGGACIDFTSRTLQAFMGHRSIANTVAYTAVTDKRIRNI